MISVVGKNYAQASAGEGIQLFQSHKDGYVDGGQLRDFVYVDDAVAATLWFLTNGPAHGLFNVGTGRASSFRELIEALYGAVGQEPRIQYVPMPDHLREKYQYFTEASTTNLRAAGYDTAFCDVWQGVKRYADYLGSGDRYR
jgi:ADP-L-glycero-D-manno-heptose 6-epimerase